MFHLPPGYRNQKTNGKLSKLISKTIKAKQKISISELVQLVYQRQRQPTTVFFESLECVKSPLPRWAVGK